MLLNTIQNGLEMANPINFFPALAGAITKPAFDYGKSIGSSFRTPIDLFLSNQNRQTDRQLSDLLFFKSQQAIHSGDLDQARKLSQAASDLAEISSQKQIFGGRGIEAKQNQFPRELLGSGVRTGLTLLGAGAPVGAQMASLGLGGALGGVASGLRGQDVFSGMGAGAGGGLKFAGLNQLTNPFIDAAMAGQASPFMRAGAAGIGNTLEDELYSRLAENQVPTNLDRLYSFGMGAGTARLGEAFRNRLNRNQVAADYPEGTQMGFLGFGKKPQKQDVSAIESMYESAPGIAGTAPTAVNPNAFGTAAPRGPFEKEANPELLDTLIPGSQGQGTLESKLGEINRNIAIREGRKQMGPIGRAINDIGYKMENPGFINFFGDSGEPVIMGHNFEDVERAKALVPTNPKRAASILEGIQKQVNEDAAKGFVQTKYGESINLLSKRLNDAYDMLDSLESQKGFLGLGLKEPTKVFRASDSTSGQSALGKGKYFTFGRGSADKWGNNIEEFTLDPKAKMLDLSDPVKLQQFTDKAIKNNQNLWLSTRNIYDKVGEIMTAEAKKRGFDGIIGDDNVFGSVVFDDKYLTPAGQAMRDGGKTWTNAEGANFKLPEIRRIEGPELNKSWKDIRGKTISIEEDIPKYVQQFSRPDRETLHVFMLDDNNKVLAHNATTSDDISAVDIHKVSKELDSRLKRTGATKFVIGHNHPSDISSHSGGDKQIITSFTKKYPDKFAGSVVAGKNEYSFIPPTEGSTSIILSFDEKTTKSRIKEGPLLPTITKPKDAFSVAVGQGIPDNKVGVLVVDARSRPLALKQVNPRDDTEQLNSIVNQAVAESKGDMAIIVSKAKNLPHIFAPEQNQYVEDIITIDDSGGFGESFKQYGRVGYRRPPDPKASRQLFGAIPFLAPMATSFVDRWKQERE